MYWEGDFFATRMVMEQQEASSALQQEEDAQELDKECKNPREELAKLKKRQGTFALCPSLITNKSVATKDLIMCIVRASWKCHSAMAKKVKSPDDTLACNINNALGGWKDELVEMVNCSLHRVDCIQHLLPQWQLHPDILSWHDDFFTQLLQTRATSLATTYCSPPMKYAHLLSEKEEISKHAQSMALQEFAALLDAESAGHKVAVRPLQAITWRLAPLVRTIYIALGRDKACGTKDAKMLLTIICKNMGDSRIIENIHQHGKDLLRSAKQDWFGDTRIMGNVLKSGVLEERVKATNIIQATNAEKVMAAGDFKQEPMKRKLTSKGYKLPKKMQELMLPKSKVHTWPSPNPASLFVSLCASQWIFSFFGPNKNSWQVGVNQAWLSALPQAG